MADRNYFKNEPKKVIPAFFQKNAIDILTYGYFVAKMSNGHSMQKTALLMQHDFDWSEDDYPALSMVRCFERMRAYAREQNIIKPVII